VELNLTQAIRTYDFVGRPAVDLGTVDTSDPDITQLLKVNSLMATGASDLTARRYESALSDYHAAESLIYSMLNPQWVPDMGPKFWPVLSRNASLFTPLLSATSQWLNVLPVPPAPSPVRPTTSAGTAWSTCSARERSGSCSSCRRSAAPRCARPSST
jgi:hypothetical protein